MGTLRQAKAGVRVVDLCRQNGISDATFYKWRSKFGGMNIGSVQNFSHILQQPVGKAWFRIELQ